MHGWAATMLLVALASAGCRPSPARHDAVEGRNAALARRWIEEGFNQRRLTVVDEVFAARFTINGQAVDRAGLKQSMRKHLEGFPDLRVTIDDLLVDGSQVGIWYTVEGTHQGEFEGIPPTGKRVRWAGFDLLQVEGDQIGSARFLSDYHGLLTQLGATLSLPRE